MQSRLSRRFVVSVVTLLATLAYAAISPAAPDAGTETIAVDTVAVVLEPRQKRSEWNGIVQAVQESSLTAQVSGRIDRIAVEAGQTVSAGEELAVIDARESSASQAQAQGQLAQARATLSGAESRWARQQRLFEQGYISQASIDEARTELAAARASVAQAKAALERQSVAGTYLSVRAPYDGVIAEVTAEVGEIAQPGRVLIRMLAPDALRVSVRVPTRIARELSGQDASGPSVAVVQVGAVGGLPQWSAPQPLQVMPIADPNSATVEMRIVLPASLSAGLRPGAYLRVATYSPDGEGLFIPAAALLQRGELQAVYVASGDQFVLRAVRVGPRDGDRLEVLSGLSVGERVALDPVRAGLLAARPAGSQ